MQNFGVPNANLCTIFDVKSGLTVSVKLGVPVFFCKKNMWSFYAVKASSSFSLGKNGHVLFGTQYI